MFTYRQILLCGILYWLAEANLPFVTLWTLQKPLVCGWIAGLVLGAPAAGAACGAILSVILLGFSSAGSSMPTDLSLAGITGAALTAAGWSPAAAVLPALMAGAAGRYIWRLRMRVNVVFARRVRTMLEEGRTTAILLPAILFPALFALAVCLPASAALLRLCELVRNPGPLFCQIMPESVPLPGHFWQDAVASMSADPAARLSAVLSAILSADPAAGSLLPAVLASLPAEDGILAAAAGLLPAGGIALALTAAFHGSGRGDRNEKNMQKNPDAQLQRGADPVPEDPDEMTGFKDPDEEDPDEEPCLAELDASDSDEENPDEMTGLSDLNEEEPIINPGLTDYDRQEANHEKFPDSGMSGGKRRSTAMLPRGALLESALLWLLFIHICYNNEWMMGQVMAVAFLPLVRRLRPEDRDGEREILLRQSSYFNTHCECGSCIPGLMASMEEKLAAGSDPEKDPHAASQEILMVRSSLMGVCGAMGDTLFQKHLIPVLLLAACLLTAVWPEQPAGPVLYAAAMTAFSFLIGLRSYFDGYRSTPMSLLERLEKKSFRSAEAGMRIVMCLLAVPAAALFIHFPFPGINIFEDIFKLSFLLPAVVAAGGLSGAAASLGVTAISVLCIRKFHWKGRYLFLLLMLAGLVLYGAGRL